jgi:hypothetical protein
VSNSKLVMNRRDTYGAFLRILSGTAASAGGQCVFAAASLRNKSAAAVRDHFGGPVVAIFYPVHEDALAIYSTTR